MFHRLCYISMIQLVKFDFQFPRLLTERSPVEWRPRSDASKCAIRRLSELSEHSRRFKCTSSVSAIGSLIQTWAVIRDGRFGKEEQSKARTCSDQCWSLQPGKHNLKFWFHSEGQHLGIDSAFSRSNSRPSRWMSISNLDVSNQNVWNCSKVLGRLTNADPKWKPKLEILFGTLKYGNFFDFFNEHVGRWRKIVTGSGCPAIARLTVVSK